MKKLNILFLLVSVAFGLNTVNGQGFKALLPLSNNADNRSEAFIAPAGLTSCSPIPTQDEVNTGPWTYIDHFYDASQAIKMGIPVVNMNASHNLKVYVKDYQRAVPCVAGDNSATLLYGQVKRTVIEIENYDASIGVDLASIAANGTLKKNTQHFYFYKDGFYNPKIDGIIANVQGKVFDVENYAVYQNVMGEVIKLLQESATKFSVNRIGVVEDLGQGDVTLVESPIIAYTLMSIKRGCSFSKTKIKFEENKDALEVVGNTYKSLGTPLNDSKPSEEVRLKVKRYLQGIKVRRMI